GSSSLNQQFAAFVYQDSSSSPGNWWSIKVPMQSAFTNCPGNVMTFDTTAKPPFGCNTTIGIPGGTVGNLQYQVNATTFGGFGKWTSLPPTLQLPANTVLDSQNVGGPAVTFGNPTTALPSFCNGHPCEVNGWGGVFGVRDGGYALGGTNFFAFQRLKLNQGTPYTASDAAIALSAGWGSTAAVSLASDTAAVEPQPALKAIAASEAV